MPVGQTRTVRTVRAGSFWKLLLDSYPGKPSPNIAIQNKPFQKRSKDICSQSMFAHRALLTACCARLVAAKLRHEPAHASEAPFDPPLPLPIPTQAMVTTTSTCIQPTSTTTGVAPILATLGTASGYDAKLQARCSPREFTHPAHAPSPCRAPHPLCAAQPVCAVLLRHSLLAALCVLELLVLLAQARWQRRLDR